MKIIETGLAPAAIGPYAQAVAANGFIFTSGQIPLDPGSGAVTGADTAAQTEQVIDNLVAVLEAAGSDLAHVVKTTCYLRDLSAFSAFNEVYASRFPGKPARACVEVSSLPRGVLVEIEAVAVPADRD